MSVITAKCDKTMSDKKNSNVNHKYAIKPTIKVKKSSHFLNCQNPFLYLPEVKDQHYKDITKDWTLVNQIGTIYFKIILTDIMIY